MMYFMVSRCLEVDVQHYFRRPYGVHRELALPCLIARGPFECVTLQGRAHFGIGDLVEKDLQTVLPFLLLLTHLAGKLGEFEDGVSLRDDRFLGLAVPFTDTGDGVVDNLHISVIDIRGEPPGEVADKQRTAVTAYGSRVDAADGGSRIVDGGFDLLPLFFDALLLGLGGFGGFALRAVLNLAGPVIIALAQRLLAAMIAEK